VPAKCKVALD